MQVMPDALAFFVANFQDLPLHLRTSASRRWLRAQATSSASRSDSPRVPRPPTATSAGVRPCDKPQ